MLLFLLACSGSDDDSAVAAPTIEWLAPTDGATVTAGDVNASIIVDGMVLTDPAKHAEEGEAEGYIVVAVDGTDVLTTAEITFTLTLEAGDHDLTASAFYDDGDEITSADGWLCAEDDTCDAVSSTISVHVGKDGID